MKYYEDFKPSGISFAERIGEPDEFDAGMGRIALGFSDLEDMIRNVIVLLLACDAKVGSIVAAELSFRQKIDLMASLFRHRLPTFVPMQQQQDVEAEFDEIVHMCRRAEELRNSYLHSSYSARGRVKITAKARQGLQVNIEPVGSSILLDVADFMAHVANIVEGLPLVIGLADEVTGSLDSLTYLKGKQVVAQFKLGA
jgi:hypothetical protein